MKTLNLFKEDRQSNHIYGYHVTSIDNIDSIIQNGFKHFIN